MELHQRGISANHKLVQKIMRQCNLFCVRRKSKYKSYKGVVGQGNMIVDILIFQVSVLLSFWVSWSLQKRRRLSGAGWTVLGLLVLLGVWALFLLFTFRAPDLAVFVDPLTGMRGIG